jgi:adenylate cyclase, class 2
MIWRANALGHYTKFVGHSSHASFVRQNKNMAGTVSKEIEVKLAVPSAATARKKIAELGARVVAHPAAGKDGRIFERNTLFDTPVGGLARHGQLLRLRTESAPSALKSDGARAVLTYKGPAENQSEGRYKIREENEVEVADAAAMRTILESLGLRGWFRYEKYRTAFAFPGNARWAAGLRIDLDETPIGAFIELEGPPEAIDRTAKELGFTPKDYVKKDYLFLHVEDCRRKGFAVSQLAPGVVTGIPDMVFPASARAKR